MSDPFIGEIRAFAFSFYPGDGNWLPCYGQSVYISQYQALYSIIGNIYGPPPNSSTFLLPNLNAPSPSRSQGLAIMGVGLAQPGGGTGSRQLGKIYGETQVTLDYGNLPAHTHQFQRRSTAGGYADKTAAPGPTSEVNGLGTSQAVSFNVMQNTGAPNTFLSQTVLTPFGALANVQAHDNIQPSLAFTFAIAVMGDYPMRP